MTDPRRCETHPLRLLLPDVDEIVLVSKGRDGFYVVSCLDLTGCRSQGKTVKEALENITDAIKASKAPLPLRRSPRIEFQEQHRPHRAVVWMEQPLELVKKVARSLGP